MKKLLFVFVAMLTLASLTFAQPDNCLIEPGDFCTRTQGGWGASCNGQNAGCMLQNNFATVFPTGLTVGGGFTIHFSSNIAVRDFLPAGGTAGALTQNYNNPLSTSAGVFAGQVTALAINVAFGDAGVAGFTDIGSLEVNGGLFDGMTVDQVLALANAVLGGDLSGLPSGAEVSDINCVVDNINQNFDNCNTNHGVLVLPGCGNEQPCPPMPPMWVEIGSTFCLEYCGTPIEVYWCCPLDGQPVFVIQNCMTGAPVPAGLTWVASYDSTGLECQAPGGYWHAIFEASESGCFCVFFDRQLAVEMLDFTAVSGNGVVSLDWATATENGNDYFEIVRNGEAVANVDAAGTSSARVDYNWVDRDVTAGTFSYELITHDLNGIRRSHGTRTVEVSGTGSAIVSEYALYQNYPNPFNPSTTISFDVPEAADVNLTVVNALGLQVATLVNGHVEAGNHSVSFNAAGMPSGIYFYVLKSGAFSSTQKMLLLK